MSRSFLPLCCLFTIFIFLYFGFLERFLVGVEIRYSGWTWEKSKELEFFEAWHECAESELNFEDDPNRFWDQFRYRMERCDNLNDVENRLEIEDFVNSDETKHAILPKTMSDTSDNILVTIGIGKDIEAELQFRERISGIGNLPKFYGADPIIHPNSDLYSKIGQYFPFAIGNKAGFSRASVLYEDKYEIQNVVHVDFLYFLDDMLGLRYIDNLWMDSEYSEYELFDAFYKEGRLENAGIVICQINLEVHNPSLEQKMQFKEFVSHILADRRYGMFRNVNYSHYRMFLVNLENDYCVQKYFSSYK